MHSVLSFISSVDVRYMLGLSLGFWFFRIYSLFPWLFVYLITSSKTYLLHLELLNFMLIAMSTQLLCGPSPGTKDVNPFIDAAMVQVARWNFGFISLLQIFGPFKYVVSVLDCHCNFQENSLVSLVVRKMLLNYITQPGIPLRSASYSIFSEGSQPSVLQRVSSAAGMTVSLMLIFCLFCSYVLLLSVLLLIDQIALSFALSSIDCPKDSHLILSCSFQGCNIAFLAIFNLHNWLKLLWMLYSFSLQQILSCCHSVIWSVQVVEAQEVHCQTAVSLCFLFSFIIINVLWAMSPWQIEVLMGLLRILFWKKIHIFLTTLTARPWKIQQILNVRYCLSLNIYFFWLPRLVLVKQFPACSWPNRCWGECT